MGYKKSIEPEGYEDNQNREQKGKEPLPEVLGGGEYTISHTDVKKTIENYYSKLGEKVKVEFKYNVNNDDGPYRGPNTFISISENTPILGIEASKKKNISMNELQKILTEILASEGKELKELKNNAITTSRTVGYGMGEHQEKFLDGKDFTIVVGENNLDGNQKRKKSLTETLGGKKREYTISHTDVKKTIENYYKENGKDVQVEFKYNINNDDGIHHGSNTFISISEKTSILGTETSKKKNIGMDELKKILTEILASEGKKLIELKNNAITRSRTVGYGMGEHQEKFLDGKDFTIVVDEEEIENSEE